MTADATAIAAAAIGHALLCARNGERRRLSERLCPVRARVDIVGWFMVVLGKSIASVGSDCAEHSIANFASFRIKKSNAKQCGLHSDCAAAEAAIRMSGFAWVVFDNIRAQCRKLVCDGFKNVHGFRGCGMMRGRRSRA